MNGNHTRRSNQLSVRWPSRTSMKPTWRPGECMRPPRECTGFGRLSRQERCELTLARGSALSSFAKVTFTDLFQNASAREA